MQGIVVRDEDGLLGVDYVVMVDSMDEAGRVVEGAFEAAVARVRGLRGSNKRFPSTGHRPNRQVQGCGHWSLLWRGCLHCMTARVATSRVTNTRRMIRGLRSVEPIPLRPQTSEVKELDA
jgi:hypothetical protein